MVQDTETILLVRGRGDLDRAELCLMQVTALVVGEQTDPRDQLLTDCPRTACPILTRFAIQLNDGMDEAHRQDLKPFAELLIETYDEGAVSKRAQHIRQTLLAVRHEARASGIHVEKAEVGPILEACWRHGEVALMRRLARRLSIALLQAILMGRGDFAAKAFNQFRRQQVQAPPREQPLFLWRQSG